MLVFCLQYGVCRPDDRSSVTTKLHLLLRGKSVYVIGSKVDLSLDIFFVVVEVIFSQASLISAASISFERLYAVYWPLKHRTLSIRVYRIAIFIVWTVAAIISVLVNLSYYVTSHKLAIYFWISYTFTLLFILSGCNIAIWRKVQGRSNPASHLQNRAIQN